MKIGSEPPCPICGSDQMEVFFEILDVPVHCNLLWPNQDAARKCPKGNIKLAFCPVCSFIKNLTFEPDRLEYTQAYDSSLHFSPRFQDYAKSLADRLIQRYDLHDKDIIEIGCGSGYFLSLLCELGNNRGVGFDPAHSLQKTHCEVNDRIKFIKDFYSDSYINYQADLIVCRHTLEHVQNPKEFLFTLRQSIDNRLNTYAFFEVPNALNIFHNLFIWDIIYEHCSYFTPTSLSLTFSSCGFRLCELNEEFQDQFLCIDIMPDDQGAPSFDYDQSVENNLIASDVASFTENYRRKILACLRELDKIEGRGHRAVVWGAGSKGVTFLNTLKPKNQIEYVVDINPRKQGMFIPGTGQRIVPPDFLREYQPDVVIVMNSIYKGEIQQFTKRLGFTPEFMDL